MKPFLRKVIYFLLLQIMLGVVLLAMCPFHATEYLAAGIDKRERLRTVQAPRLILVGGSNLAFGMDCRMLAEKTGFKPVNMGLHASLGMDYMLTEVEELIAAGDVIVISMEYSHFESDQTQWGLVATEWAMEPAILRQFSWHHWAGFLDHGLLAVGARLRGVMGTQPQETYHRGAFNEFGDCVSHWDKPTRLLPRAAGASWRARLNAHRMRAALSRIEDFVVECRQRGGRVLWSYPPLAESYFDSALAEAVRDGLSQYTTITQLNRPRDTVYPESFFYDTEYHLTGEGVAKRSQALGETLVGVLARPPH